MTHAGGDGAVTASVATATTTVGAAVVNKLFSRSMLCVCQSVLLFDTSFIPDRTESNGIEFGFFSFSRFVVQITEANFN